MPLRGGHLTPRERAFAKVYARTADTAYAAYKAGFRSMSGGTNALARPGVRAEVERLFREELQGEILPLALKRHRQLLSDNQTRGPALVKAIEMSYKFALAKREDDTPRELHEMSAGELARAILDVSLDPYVTEVQIEPPLSQLDPIFD